MSRVVEPTQAELEAKERVLRSRERLEMYLDNLIKLAHLHADSEDSRSLVLGEVDILIEFSHQERSAYRDAVVAAYQGMAAKRSGAGNA